MSALDDFARFCALLPLENAERMKLEDFERQLLAGYFDGVRETVALLPKGSGKSTLIAALGLFELVSDPTAEGVVCAASRDQAAIILRQAAGFISRSPALRARLRIKQREIVHRDGGGRLRVIASDVDTADGLILSFAIADELHRWKDSSLYAILAAGVDKRGGQLVAISTAGVREEGVLWDMRERVIERGAARDGAYLHLTEPDFHWHEWSLPDDGDPRDLDQVKAANPAPWVTTEVLRRRFESAATVESDWLRFSCNRWLERSVLDVVISVERWAELVDRKCSSLSPACFAIDVTPDRSAAAISTAAFDGPAEDRGVVVEVLDHGMGLAWVIERAIQLDARHHHVGFILDGAGPAGALIPRLEERGIELHVTTAREYARACQSFYDLVAEGRLRHRGDAPFDAAVQAAGRRKLTDGWAWSRSNSLGDISPLVAATLAAHGIQTYGPVSEEAFNAL